MWSTQATLMCPFQKDDTAASGGKESSRFDANRIRMETALRDRKTVQTQTHRIGDSRIVVNSERILRCSHGKWILAAYELYF